MPMQMRMHKAHAQAHAQGDIEKTGAEVSGWCVFGTEKAAGPTACALTMSHLR